MKIPQITSSYAYGIYYFNNLKPIHGVGTKFSQLESLRLETHQEMGVKVTLNLNLTLSHKLLISTQYSLLSLYTVQVTKMIHVACPPKPVPISMLPFWPKLYENIPDY